MVDQPRIDDALRETKHCKTTNMSVDICFILAYRPVIYKCGILIKKIRQVELFIYIWKQYGTFKFKILSSVTCIKTFRLSIYET